MRAAVRLSDPRAVPCLADAGGGAPSLRAGGREKPPKKQAAGMSRAASRRRRSCRISLTWAAPRVIGAGCGVSRRRGRAREVRAREIKMGEGRRSKSSSPKGNPFGLLLWEAAVRTLPDAAFLPQGRAERKKRGLPQAFAAADPFFQSVPVCFGDALCAGCSTALPWPVRPARRRRTPPERAPARPRPGPWPHTALPFRSS